MVFSRFHHAITNFLYSFARKFIHDTMEELLHYCWKHKLLPLGELHTTRGEQIEVIDTGLHNHHAGPDFFNAKIKVDGTLWIGNVEMHDKATDWYQHGHDKDSRYDNVVLHVVGKADGEVHTADGRRLPQLVLEVPAVVVANYQELLKTDTYPPCYKVIPDLSVLVLHAWMSALLTERLEQRTEAVKQRVAAANGSWEDAYFVTLARSFGFGINGDAFETWARSIPLQAVAHHRDDLFQVEAFFLGQAGLLEEDTIPERYREQARTGRILRQAAIGIPLSGSQVLAAADGFPPLAIPTTASAKLPTHPAGTVGSPLLPAENRLGGSDRLYDHHGGAATALC